MKTLANEIADRWISNDLTRYDVKGFSQELIDKIYSDIAERYCKDDADWFLELVEASKNA